MARRRGEKKTKTMFYFSFFFDELRKSLCLQILSAAAVIFLPAARKFPASSRISARSLLRHLFYFFIYFCIYCCRRMAPCHVLPLHAPRRRRSQYIPLNTALIATQSCHTNAFRRGCPSNLPPLPICLADEPRLAGWVARRRCCPSTRRSGGCGRRSDGAVRWRRARQARQAGGDEEISLQSGLLSPPRQRNPLEAPRGSA